MAFQRIPNAGAAGVLKDLSVHELPPNCWTDALNMRFLNGYVSQFLGHSPAYGVPAVTPYHTVAVETGAIRYWMYASDKKIYVTTITNGVAVHTNLTRQTAGADVNYAATPNSWTSTLLSGIPILNPGNLVDPPQQWSQDLTSRCKVLDNWPANTFCQSLRAYNNILIALGVTKAGLNLPYMVKFSTEADPGAVPITWDPSDPTNDAGEFDIAQGGDPIIDGLQLRNSFMVYKEQSCWRLDYVGGTFILSNNKVLGMSGALNRNCIVELDGVHFVLTNNDAIIHDGQTAQSVLDGAARLTLFQDMDSAATGAAFVFKNPFLNEVFICYASVGFKIPNRALVYNYKSKTVTYREMPNVYHANYGAVNDQLGRTWASATDPWQQDLARWNGPGFTPNTARVLLASADPQLYLLDSSSAFNGKPVSSYLERRGINFGADEQVVLVKGIRPRITGNVGETVIIDVGTQDDPYTDPVYKSITYTIGQQTSADCFVSGRYHAVRFRSGTAFTWRLDSYDMEIEQTGWY